MKKLEIHEMEKVNGGFIYWAIFSMINGGSAWTQDLWGCMIELNSLGGQGDLATICAHADAAAAR